MPVHVDFFFNFFFALLASASRLILLLVYELQPKPYMDEIFHVPQVQAYCNNNFSTWDPMITTLPGLYLFSVGVLKPLGFILKSDLCNTTYCLRSVNIVFSIGTFYLASLVTAKKNKHAVECSDKSFTLTGLSVVLFPILYFFNFLYYTDSGSTFFVLFAYLLHLHGCHKKSALLGAISVLFRQTNIVWVVFFGWLSGIPVLSGEKRFRNRNFSGKNELDHITDIKMNLRLVLRSTSKSNFRPLVTLGLDLLEVIWPYCLVVVGFATFLFLNGGIVLGAKSDHEAGFHLCQLLYFSAFSLAFLLPVIPLLRVFRDFIRFLNENRKLSLLLFITILLVIHFTTVAHRYILADNRHYTFYVWKNIFQRHVLVRYALSPIYLFSIIALWNLIKPSNPLWKLGFISCLAAALIPASLIEPRYFIIPFLLVRLNLKPVPSYFRLLAELCMHAFINAAALYMFLYKPFVWQGSEELQRFMY